jgi:hypothetical protein
MKFCWDLEIHILHHAGRGPVVGQWMLNELRSHCYKVSPGYFTLFCIAWNVSAG